MEFSNEQINEILVKYKKEVDKISGYYNYPNNISHLLYLIIPAFIIKYGFRNEQIILKCFNEVPILIDDKKDKIYQAYYFSRPKLISEKITTIKGIVLNNYENISLMQLLDNLVHEFNHAVNSINNEVKVTDKEILIRTGMSNIVYNKETLIVINKEQESIIEEVINTKQTEKIINIISNFLSYNIEDSEIESTIYAIGQSSNNNYKSDAYFLQSYVINKLIENKTFINTLEDLRFKGHISEIDYWFDSITNQKGSLKKLSSILMKSLELELKLNKKLFFKGSLIKRIQKLNNEAMVIVNTFDNNCNYK